MRPQNPSYAHLHPHADHSQTLQTIKVCNTCFSCEHDDSACPGPYAVQQATLELKNNTPSTGQLQTAGSRGHEKAKQDIPKQSQPDRPTPRRRLSLKTSTPANMQTIPSQTDNDFPSIVEGSLHTSLLNSPLTVTTADKSPLIWSTPTPMPMHSYVWTETVPNYAFSSTGGDFATAFIPSLSGFLPQNAYCPEVWLGCGDERSYFDDAIWSDQFQEQNEDGRESSIV